MISTICICLTMLHELAKSHAYDTRMHEVNEKEGMLFMHAHHLTVFILDVQTLRISWNDGNHSGLHFPLSYHQTMIFPGAHTGP